VAARGIYFAAHHRRRELWIGGSTVMAIEGNKLAPGWLDFYLGKTGYQAQQIDEPEDPKRPNNLWEPVPGDHGAHGSFGDRARDDSAQLWLAEKRNWLALGLLGIFGAAFGIAAAAGRQERREHPPGPMQAAA
jgi:hypothetical protein